MAVTVYELLHDMRELTDALPQTVDRLHFGDWDSEVSGVACAFSASQQVVAQAAALGANLLIVHEGLFYSHQDRREFLENDPVYQDKLRLIANSGIAVYRCHDYWHRVIPDGITAGLLGALDWERYVIRENAYSAVAEIPVMSLAAAAAYVKTKLGLSYVRAAGESALPCRRVGITVGYRGGAELAVPLFNDGQLDLLIAGEGPEWETPEYIKDAVQQGRPKALIMLGHAESEAPGMRYLADRLRTSSPGLPVYFIPDDPVFRIL